MNKASNILILVLLISAIKSADVGPLPVLENFTLASLTGQWVVGLANDLMTDNYQRTSYYACHTFLFNQPGNGTLTFTESFYAPFYTQWNYWNRTFTYYFNPSQQYVLYLDQAMTLPVYYAVYQDSTSILFMSNTSASQTGCNALGLTLDNPNVTFLYPIADKISSSIKCTPNFFNYGLNTNLGCTTILNKAIPASQANLLELIGIWNITLVWSSPSNTTWSTLDCLNFIAERDFFLEFEYEITYYDSKSVLDKWKQIEFNDLYIDVNSPGVWFRDAAPPYVVIYFNVYTRRAVLLSGTRQLAYFLSNNGSPSASDIALFEAELLQAGILANPLNIQKVSQSSACGMPPFATRKKNSTRSAKPETVDI